MAERLKRAKEEFIGIFFTLLSVYLGLALLSYYKWDPSFFTETSAPVRNYGGIVGSYLSDLLISIFGLISYSFPLFLSLYGIKRLFGKEKNRQIFIGGLFLIILASLLFTLLVKTLRLNITIPTGGIIGEEIVKLFIHIFSLPGAFIVILSMIFSCIVLISPLSNVNIFTKMIERKKDSMLKKKTDKEKLVNEKLKTTLENNKSSKIKVKEDNLDKKKVEPISNKPLLDNRKTEIKIKEYKLPPISLLQTYESTFKPSKEELLEKAKILQQKLLDFNITGRITHVYHGPVVTIYEFEPSAGIKINKIISVEDDLGRALGGLNVRIAPIPGKTQLGIEVTNKQREIICLKDIISSEVFVKSKSLLTLALGKNIYGRAVVSDLVKMPHLLIGGTTGSGKSVLINSIIMSILYKAAPNKVKILMIDPKLLELSKYDGIPHLITPVVTNSRDAIVALKKMVLEMETRYKLIAQQGVKNIDNYNCQVPLESRLPYIVVIIDELADIMFNTSKKEIEDSIVRLAQMSRAAGIHLVIATQRPSSDIITGIIKANFPTRIAFQVASRMDSRTIIDVKGAEKLTGKGDMLLMTPGAKLIRLHGAYVSQEEIRSTVEFVKAGASPDYSMFDTINLANRPLY